MGLTKAHPPQETVSITLEVPVEIARLYGAAPDQVGRHVLEQAAVEGYRSRELSRGQVARLLGFDWEETEEFLAQHQCDRHYDQADLELDRKNIEKIFGPA